MNAGQAQDPDVRKTKVQEVKDKVAEEVHSRGRYRHLRKTFVEEVEV